MYPTAPLVIYIMDLLASKIANTSDSEAYVQKFDLKCKKTRSNCFLNWRGDILMETSAGV